MASSNRQFNPLPGSNENPRVFNETGIDHFQRADTYTGKSSAVFVEPKHVPTNYHLFGQRGGISIQRANSVPNYSNDPRSNDLGGKQHQNTNINVPNFGTTPAMMQSKSQNVYMPPSRVRQGIERNPCGFADPQRGIQHGQRLQMMQKK